MRLTNWLINQIVHHPRAGPTLVSLRIVLWGYTFVWGWLTFIINDSLRDRVYSFVPFLRTNDNIVGLIVMLVSGIQLGRIIFHHRGTLLGVIANCLCVFWYLFLLISMFMFIPLSGPTYPASITLMTILSITSLWNDPWMNGVK